ncbi:MAG: 2-amino-4-hydroxy-6-hydroxymethyldihydropteridine diphosphokinase [Bacteroidetes bacterium]|nr:MAG: 2-amino-4-hydroxy-6-hydroxymethyldihydropteridine diphosphokinase [Bacteroidota bacterium]
MDPSSTHHDRPVYLSLGSNLGDRMAHLIGTVSLISRRVGPIVLASPVFQSPPWGYKSSNAYYNACIEVDSAMEPQALMRSLLAIERELGRKRSGAGYSDRNIDIDLLFYGTEVISEPGLQVPHPRILSRRFVLQPLAEIAPGFVHPVEGKTIVELLRSCPDQQLPERLSHLCFDLS